MEKGLNVSLRQTIVGVGRAPAQRNPQVTKLSCLRREQTPANTPRIQERTPPPAYHPVSGSPCPKCTAPLPGNPAAPPVYRPGAAAIPNGALSVQRAGNQLRVPAPPVYRPRSIPPLQARMNPTAKSTRNVAPAPMAQRVTRAGSSARAFEARRFSSGVVQRMLSLSSSGGSNGSDDGEDPRKRGERMSQAIAILDQVRGSWDLIQALIDRYRQPVLNVLASNVNNYNNNHLMGATLFWLLSGIRSQLQQLWNQYENLVDQQMEPLLRLSESAYETMDEEWDHNSDIHTQADHLLDELIDFFHPYATSVFQHQGNPPVHGLFDWPAPIHLGDRSVQEAMAAEGLIGTNITMKELKRK